MSKFYILILLLVTNSTCRADTLNELEKLVSPNIQQIAEEKIFPKAVELARLISNYTPENAEAQFQTAKNLITENYQKDFSQFYLKDELRAIQVVRRTQSLDLNGQNARFAFLNFRDQNTLVATITVSGWRIKKIKDLALPPERVTACIPVMMESNGGNSPFTIAFQTPAFFKSIESKVEGLNECQQIVFK